MIITVDWTTFHMMYYNQNTIYCKETDDAFEFWTSQDMFFVKSVVAKKEDQAENMIFIERYLTGVSNVIKVKDITEGNMVTIPEPSESDEAIRDEDEIDLEMNDDDYIDNLDKEEENEL